MRIFITGGTGFVGQTLVKHLTATGHQITLLSRKTNANVPAGVRLVKGDPTIPGPWQNEMRYHEAGINLAGSSIFCRWTTSNRQRILDSRSLSTRNIVNALSHPDNKVKVVLNCSAVGYYGNRGDEELSENSQAGQGFLAEICRVWEAEAIRAEGSGVRVVRCRLGVVLGQHGGALKQMTGLFRIGLGTRLGNGRQWFPWIHQTDLARIFAMALEDPVITGPINCVAPQAVTNLELTRTLAAELHRPLLLPPAPAVILKLLQGEASALLLDSQKVVPTLLTRIGFIYNSPNLADTLSDLLGTPDAVANHRA